MIRDKDQDNHLAKSCQNGFYISSLGSAVEAIYFCKNCNNIFQEFLIFFGANNSQGVLSSEAIKTHNKRLTGRGGTHILRHTGMCRSTGSLFHKKSLNMGPIFYKKHP